MDNPQRLSFAQQPRPALGYDISGLLLTTAWA